MRPKHKRLILILITLTSVAIGSYLILSTFQKNIVFFLTPTEALKEKTANKTIRIGGVVKRGSLKKNGTTYMFDLMDKETVTPVTYTGLLPDLFKEDTTVVTQGQFNEGAFIATEVLAKHDENYRPLEIDGKM